MGSTPHPLQHSPAPGLTHRGSTAAPRPQRRQKAFGKNLPSVLPAGRSWGVSLGSSSQLLRARQPPPAPLCPPRQQQAAFAPALTCRGPCHAGRERLREGDRLGCSSLPYIPPKYSRPGAAISPAGVSAGDAQLGPARSPWDAEASAASPPSATIPTPQPQCHLSHPSCETLGSGVGPRGRWQPGEAARRPERPKKRWEHASLAPAAERAASTGTVLLTAAAAGRQRRMKRQSRAHHARLLSPSAPQNAGETRGLCQG